MDYEPTYLNVGELIKKLSKLPKGAHIYVKDTYGDLVRCEDIDVSLEEPETGKRKVVHICSDLR